jgi:hypothetical protein
VIPSPIAFMSYARDDDAHERGRLSELRTRLTGEVAAQSGDPFPIFQDREDIAWGEQWRKRINGSIESVTFLIPILTPRFFRSNACRDELERFLQREQELGRGDLILPIYYLDSPPLNDPAKRSSDALAETIHSRQYWDWRQLRFESFESKQVGETIAKMAKEIIAALERPAPADPAPTLSELGVRARGIAKPFKEAIASYSPAFFFPRSATIASSGSSEQKYSFDGDSVIYLRMFPKLSDKQPNVGRAALKNIFRYARSINLNPMSTTIGGIISSNDYGWVIIDPTGIGTTKGVTQGFPTGELWGINSEVFLQTSMQRYFTSPTEPATALAVIRAEKLYTQAIENYTSVATSELKLQLPFVVEFGAVGLKGVFLGAPAWDPSRGPYFGPFREDSLIRRYELADASQETALDTLGAFLEELYDLAECRRSEVLSDEQVRLNKIPRRT